MPKLANLHTCTGCLACVDNCPKGALSSCYNEEGHLTYNLNIESCVECGLCERTCPVVSKFNYGSNVLSDSIPYAAWAKNDELRARSTSGGVFASFAKYIISRGGVVVGASLEQNDIKHIIIDREEDIIKLQGSKYAQSNTDGVYKAVKAFLQSGKSVLFSGMGCQVAGLLSYLGKREYSGNLYTVDIICGGVPSRFLIDHYLKTNPQVNEIVAFRNKSNYEFSVRDKRGEVEIVPLSERPLPLCGFYWEMTNRYCCYNCHYAYNHRRSDLTIGDLWGDKRFLEQHKEGISLVIVHSTKGGELLNQSDVESHIVEWKDVLPYNTRIAYGKNLLVRTRERKRLSVAFKEDCYQQLLDDYANDASFKRPWSVIKKIYRVILITINHRIAVAHINKLLKG